MWVLPGIFAAQFLGMVVSPNLQKILGLRMTTLLGCWIMYLGLLLSSYAQDLKTFFVLHGLMFGAGIGTHTIYMRFVLAFLSSFARTVDFLYKYSQVWATLLR